MSIEEGAFTGCSSLSSIHIPNGITSISAFTFSDCDSLSSIDFPFTIKNVGEYAFAYCDGLNSVDFGYGVKNVGAYAFYCCSTLSNIDIPDLSMDIGSAAFYGTEWLKNQTEDEYVMIGLHYIYVGEETGVTVPSPLQSVDFCGNETVQVVILPDSMDSIGAYAFAGCSSLEYITIPDSVTSIGNYAFSDCSNLKSSVSVFSWSPNIISIGEGAFSGCSKLPYFYSLDNIERIGAEAFAGCSSLNRINLSDSSITSIENGTFYGCSSLWNITIPNSVTSIADYAFSGCAFSSITIPDSVTSIGRYTFQKCNSLSSINIPNGVTEIKEGTFASCRKLRNIDIPDSVDSIGAYAFYYCSSLNVINIPDGVTVIKESTFEACENLKKVRIPDSITSIRETAFYNCLSLNELDIPSSVTSIDSLAFSGNILLRVEESSFAEQYAKEQGLSYKTLQAITANEEKDRKLDAMITDRGWRLDYDGKSYEAVMGRTGALIWEYVEATFNEQEHYRSTFVKLNEQGEIERRAGWHRWFSFEEFRVTHIGTDMFRISSGNSWSYPYYLDAIADKAFSEKIFSEDDEIDFSFLAEYSEGYAPCSYKGKFAWVDRSGSMIVMEDAQLSGQCSILSDGIFYCGGKFYDFYCNEVLDISDKDYGKVYIKSGIFEPGFVNGECRLITEKNGKHWIFTIDREGNIISEIEEIDILWLSI